MTALTNTQDRTASPRRAAAPALTAALFAVLAVYVTLTVNRIVEPAITRDLLFAALLGLAVGLPPLVDRRLFLLTPALLVVGAYAVIRLVSPLPEDVVGRGEQYVYYMQELRFGFNAYKEAIFPLTLTGVPGLRLLVVFWVYLIVSAASIIALGGRRTLTGVIVLLVLLAFTLTVDGATRDVLIGGGYLAVLVGLLIITQAQGRRRWGVGDLVSGLALGAIAVAVGLLVLQTTPGIASGAWQNWRTWQPFGGQNRELVFNWRQNYPRLLDPQNEFPVMRVASPIPSYWRANTLEVFTGDAWLSSGSFYEALEPEAAGAVEVPVEGARPPGPQVTQRFLLEAISTTYLFVGGHPIDITQDSGGRVYTSGHGALRAEIPLQPPSGYEVTAVAPEVTPAELVNRGRDYPETIAEEYLELPIPTAAEVARQRDNGVDWEPEIADASPRGGEFIDAYGLNESIVRNATDPYQIALRIERFLRTRYDYSLDLPASEFVSPYAAFLLDTRVGYCQQFAGSMALLMRLNEIPARVAVGFTTGEEVEDGTYVVRTDNAHSWVEVYFPDVGWIAFDPTPGRGLPTVGASSTSPGFEDPFPAEPLPDVQLPVPASPLELPEGAGADPDLGPESSGGQGSSRLARAALIAGGIVLTAIAWPIMRSRWRRHRLRRGTPAQQMRASLEAIHAYASCAGMEISKGSTMDEIADVLEAELNIPAGAVRHRSQQVFYGGREPRSADAREIERLRMRAERNIDRRLGWVWMFATWYGGPRLGARTVRRKTEGLDPVVTDMRPAAGVGPAG